jgi:hypothetical protein
VACDVEILHIWDLAHQGGDLDAATARIEAIIGRLTGPGATDEDAYWRQLAYQVAGLIAWKRGDRDEQRAMNQKATGAWQELCRRDRAFWWMDWEDKVHPPSARDCSWGEAVRRGDPARFRPGFVA